MSKWVKMLANDQKVFFSTKDLLGIVLNGFGNCFENSFNFNHCRTNFGGILAFKKSN
jgi:hypothetical protein